jgi:hypothetical protein
MRRAWQANASHEKNMIKFQQDNCLLLNLTVKSATRGNFSARGPESGAETDHDSGKKKLFSLTAENIFP